MRAFVVGAAPSAVSGRVRSHVLAFLHSSQRRFRISYAQQLRAAQTRAKPRRHFRHGKATLTSLVESTGRAGGGFNAGFQEESEDSEEDEAADDELTEQQAQYHQQVLAAQELARKIHAIDSAYPAKNLSASLIRELDRHATAVAAAMEMKTESKREPRVKLREEQMLKSVSTILRKKLTGTPHLQDEDKLVEQMDHVLKKDAIPLLCKALMSPQDSSALVGFSEGSDVIYREAPLSAESKAGPQHGMINESLRRAKRVLDVEVSFEQPLESGMYNIPDPERTIIMTNLPLDVTELELREALQPCGSLSSVELCRDWVRQPLLSADSSHEEAHLLPEHTLKFNPMYAIIEFQDLKGKHAATRQAAKTFGILVMEMVNRKTSMGVSNVGRAAYPQDARFKHCLFLSGLPWSYQPQDILAACARGLTNFGPVFRPCTLQATNCSIFGMPGDIFVAKMHQERDLQMSVLSQPRGPAVAIPSTAEAPRRVFASDGLAVLRFQSFEEAHVARQLLVGALSPASCGFSPLRPRCLEVDSAGQQLQAPHFLDLPLPASSSHYSSRQWDPVHRWGIHTCIFNGASRPSANASAALQLEDGIAGTAQELGEPASDAAGSAGRSAEDEAGDTPSLSPDSVEWNFPSSPKSRLHWLKSTGAEDGFWQAHCGKKMKAPKRHFGLGNAAKLKQLWCHKCADMLEKQFTNVTLRRAERNVRAKKDVESTGEPVKEASVRQAVVPTAVDHEVKWVATKKKLHLIEGDSILCKGKYAIEKSGVGLEAAAGTGRVWCALCARRRPELFTGDAK